MIIDFSDELLGKKAVGVSQGGSDQVGESCSYAAGEGVGRGVSTDGTEPS